MGKKPFGWRASLGPVCALDWWLRPHARFAGREGLGPEWPD